MNMLKTTLLMALMTGLLVAVGGSMGGQDGAMMMLAVSFAMNFGSYWFSDKIVLASSGAREITREQAPQLFNLVEQLAKRAGLPMPKVCVIDSEVPNAFATGRNPEHAAVAVTTGIMRALEYDELAGVLAHELSHIKHYDTLISTVAASLAGVISMIGHIAQWGAILGGFGGRDRENNGGAVGFIFTVIVAPFAAMLIQLGISRSREYEADRSGGEICGNPLSLAAALEKIEAYSAQMRALPTASTTTAHMYIINPLKKVSFASLFSTHPATSDRVERLKAQAREMGRY